MLARLRDWAHRAKRDVMALYLATRDPRTPWLAKVVATCAAAYALSPIDLIPDFVPVLGYLDDLIIVPLGILLVVKLIPPGLMAEYRAMAAGQAKQASYGGMAAILAIWIGAGAALLWWLWPAGSF